MSIPPILLEAWPTNSRKQFRVRLALHRGQYVQGLRSLHQLECPVCLGVLNTQVEAPDLHEVSWTKDDARSLPDEFKHYINHPCNCVFRHHDSFYCVHTSGHGGDEVLWKCTLSIVQWEGTARVTEYLEAMRDISKSIGAQIYQRFVSMNLPVLEGKKPFSDNQFSKEYDWL